MRVAIDIRRAGDYGFGTYIRNIVNQLGRMDQQTDYLLIGRRKHLEQFEPLPAISRSSTMPTIPGRCTPTCISLGFARTPRGHSPHALVLRTGGRADAACAHDSRSE